MREVGKHAGDNASNIKTYVVGLKLDKANPNRQVKKDSCVGWAKQRSFEGYYEVTAKDKGGYFDLFSDITQRMVD